MTYALPMIAGLFVVARWLNTLRHVGGGWINDLADSGEIASWPLALAFVVLVAIRFAA